MSEQARSEILIPWIIGVFVGLFLGLIGYMLGSHWNHDILGMLIGFCVGDAFGAWLALSFRN